MVRTRACCHERWTNRGANAMLIPTKRTGGCGMAVSLGGDVTNLAVTSASSLRPAQPPAKLAKVELRINSAILPFSHIGLD